jgi:hypothetical protein
MVMSMPRHIFTRRMQQILVEMSAPEFRFQFRIEGQPRKARLQLAGVRRIRQIGEWEVDRRCSLSAPYSPAQRPSMICGTFWSKKLRAGAAHIMSN